MCPHLVEQSELIFGPRGGAGSAPDVDAHSWPSSTTPFGHCDRSVGVTFSVAPLMLDRARCGLHPTALVACNHVSATCRGEFGECLANPDVVERIRGEWGSRESALARAAKKPDYIWEDVQCWIGCPHATDIVEFAMKDLNSDLAFEKFEVWKNASFAPELMKALLCGEKRLRHCGHAVGALKAASWGEEVAMFLAEQYEPYLPAGPVNIADPLFLFEFRLWSNAPWAAKVLSYLAEEHWFDVLYYTSTWIEKSGEDVTDGILGAIEKDVWRSRSFGNPLCNIAGWAIEHFESWRGAPRAVELVQTFITRIHLPGVQNDYVVLGKIGKLLQDNPQFGDDSLRESLRNKHGWSTAAA